MMGLILAMSTTSYAHAILIFLSAKLFGYKCYPNKPGLNFSMSLNLSMSLVYSRLHTYSDTPTISDADLVNLIIEFS
jgi:hypothetical protein